MTYHDNAKAYSGLRKWHEKILFAPISSAGWIKLNNMNDILK